ncbi:hypothetical protein NK718_02500 [Alsobacter sp. SYSU M60028]|uniref:Uncharacterized protein n=1 Tax=Alsobacter ponti TaxID=2962936 RepID=A0ABT1L8W6_9HYPH|nr:hypothetical protein [Alsobacter ponti]MCP8937373.1 hypothetical protein [Alsobacter ponti]
MKTRRTVWMGLSTFAAGAAIAPLAQAQTKPAPHAHDAPAKPTAGGEGGEGGEAGAARAQSLSANLKFYRAIALIRGHLLVGDELVKAGRWAEALPHFLHPGEEIYPTIKGDLRAYGLRPFESGLKSLAQTVKAKRAEPYGAAIELVRGQIAPADEGLRKMEKDWTRFVVETALEVLRQATDEYGEAIEGGRFAKVVEYQDARGFVWEADRLIESIADALKAKDAEALESLRADMTALKAAWPSAMPPAKPVKDLGGVLGDVARVELHAGRFL